MLIRNKLKNYAQISSGSKKKFDVKLAFSFSRKTLKKENRMTIFLIKEWIF